MAQSIDTLYKRGDVEMEEIEETLEHSLNSKAAFNQKKVIDIIIKMSLGNDDLHSIKKFIEDRIHPLNNPKYSNIKKLYVGLIGKISNMIKFGVTIDETREDVKRISETGGGRRKRGKTRAADRKEMGINQTRDHRRLEQQRRKPEMPEAIDTITKKVKERVYSAIREGLTGKFLKPALKFFRELNDKNERSETGYILSKKEMITLKRHIANVRSDLDGQLGTEKFAILVNINTHISNRANNKSSLNFKEIQDDFDNFDKLLTE
ncbi:MAG: hypothetical protein PHS92_02160 [Candidatus Gracilibacteria bacterium]|nr:hypothetical protein [Candidatus Gracilibacteria bacterium]